MVQVIQFNEAEFRCCFPQFASDVTFPSVQLRCSWDGATDIIRNQPYCSGFRPNQLSRALDLLTAHLASLGAQVATGSNTALVQTATIDKVSVSIVPPPAPNQWQWWLNQTPYGQQLLVLLQVASVGGFFAGRYPTTFTMPR